MPTGYLLDSPLKIQHSLPIPYVERADVIRKRRMIFRQAKQCSGDFVPDEMPRKMLIHGRIFPVKPEASIESESVSSDRADEQDV